jgi:hypothetical protein
MGAALRRSNNSSEESAVVQPSVVARTSAETLLL